MIVASNFAIGAVLMQRFAAEASRFFPAVEIIELHHDGKADAPSGTALATVRRILEERSGRRRLPRRPNRSPARAAPTSRACACTRCACPVSSRTRR